MVVRHPKNQRFREFGVEFGGAGRVERLSVIGENFRLQ